MRAIALAIVIGCVGIEIAIKKAHGLYKPSTKQEDAIHGAIALVFIIFLIFGV
jgi:hypothetical protein